MRAAACGLVLLAAGAGCGAQERRVELRVDVPPTVRTEGRDLAFHGRVTPADADVRLARADGTVTRTAPGAFVVRLLALRRGAITAELVATRDGAGAATASVAVVRDALLASARREPQAARVTGHGTPGASDPSGGRIDLGIVDFAVRPRRARAQVSQPVSWHNLDHADHLLRGTAGSARSFAPGRIGYDERLSYTPLRPGTLRYACIIHPWVSGVVEVGPRGT